MITNPTNKGKTSEAVILAALVRRGKHILVPWGEERYDLAVDDNGRLIRIQCKTGSLRNGCIVFKTCITDARRPRGDGGYAGQIDAFAVYCPELNRTYLVRLTHYHHGTAATYMSTRRTTGRLGISAGRECLNWTRLNIIEA